MTKPNASSVDLDPRSERPEEMKVEMTTVSGRPLRPFRDKELLPSLQLFHGVALEAVEGYLDRMGEILLAPGEVLLSPGQPNCHLYIVLRGELSVHLQSLESPPLVRLPQGECVGEMSIIDNARTSAFVVAAVATRLLAIDQETLWLLVNGASGVARNLLYVLAGRVRSDNNTIVGAVEAQREWERHAMVDALTGLHNRRWLQQMLDRLMERSRHDGEPLSLLMADLDHFKRCNDRYGHLVGDQVLGAVARTLQDNLRPGDTAARFGGEEFVVVLPQTSLEMAMTIGERIRKAVAAMRLHSPTGEELSAITLSVGVAEMHGDMDGAFLLNAADAALYRAKAQGRNRVAT